MSEELEREAFEATFEDKFFSSCFEREDDGSYAGRGLQGVWLGWQARARLSPPGECVSGPRELLAMALEAVESTMQDAYNRGGQVCCGVGNGPECCGCPDPDWSAEDQAIMGGLAPAQRELRTLLAQQPANIITCIGKGGQYEPVGVSTGAGTSRDEERVIYRDCATGRLFHREPRDYAARMAPLAQQGKENSDG